MMTWALQVPHQDSFTGPRHIGQMKKSAGSTLIRSFAISLTLHGFGGSRSPNIPFLPTLMSFAAISKH